MTETSSEYEKCQKCGVVGTDRRTLHMACFYEMSELGIPFEKIGLRGAVVERVDGTEQRPWGPIPRWSNTAHKREDRDAYVDPIFTLRGCKGCRGEWMQAIKAWFQAPPGDISRWNNDARYEASPIAVLLAQLEELRTSAVGLMKQIEQAVYATREEHDARERAAAVGRKEPSGG